MLVEGEASGAQMEDMFEDDLADSREMLLDGAGRSPKPDAEHRVERPRARHGHRFWPVASSGSGSRALASAARAGGAAFTGSSAQLERHERTALAAAGGGLIGAALVGSRFPRFVAWPLAAASGLIGGSALARALSPRNPRSQRG